MPILGIFGKKSKGKRANGPASSGASDIISNLSSTSTEHISTDSRHIPTSPNGRTNDITPASKLYPSVAASKSTSKLRLPFGRKSTTGASTTSTSKHLSPPRPSYIARNSTSAASDSEAANLRRLAPPPSKSTIFGASNDSNGALSTRSLPSDPTTSKRPFFNWGVKSNSNLPPPPVPPLKTGATDDSFNLKSFRHVGPPSPNHSDVSLARPPRPRPRGESTTSESSQRISVAAFREAQARRSAAGSPAPSFRAPSPHGIPPPRKDSSPAPRSVGRPPLPQSAPPRRSTALYTSEEDETSEEEEEEEDSEESIGLRRRRTVTQRRSSSGLVAKARATRSEVGHGSSSHQKSDSAATARLPPLSTSFSSNNAPRYLSPTTSTSASQQSSAVISLDDHDSDDDDTPLATLVRPPASPTLSNRSLPNKPKPLVDISELRGPPKLTVSTAAKSTDVAFTPGATLVSGRRPTAESPVDTSPVLTSRSPPTRFVSPPGSPEKKPLELNAPAMVVRKSPMRRETDTSSVSTSGSGGAKRDVLGDRLKALGASAAPPNPSRVTSPANPIRATSPINPTRVASPSKPARVASPQSEKNTDMGPAGGAEEEETLKPRMNKSPGLGHRRSASDHFGLSATRQSTTDLDADLADVLGGGIRLISRNGEDSESEDDKKEGDKKDAPQMGPFLPPIPIKHRTPAPSFSVTSRPPQHVRNSLSVSDTSTANVGPPRQRSSTLLITPTSPSFTSSPSVSPTPPKDQVRPKPPKPITSKSSPAPNSSPSSFAPRQRSSTALPAMQNSSVSSSPPKSLYPTPPSKPFASPSPASSTGDSSSGRAPITPRDDSSVSGSSAVGTGGKQWSGGVSGLGLNPRKPMGHVKRRSVSFEEQVEEKVKETPAQEETRRRERRRSEAKAAIELGNVINGRGPIDDDDDDEEDDDEDRPINQTRAGRASNMNMSMGPMVTGQMPPAQMPFAASPSGTGWNGMNWPQVMPMQMPIMTSQQMLSPTPFMVPPPTDPAMFAAHQQAMMFAKQAYQMAVAQQAMAAAGEEWERGSAVGGSVYGGGASTASMYGMPTGMNMNMNMMGQNWSTGSMIFPSTSRSVYGGGAQSEYGGPSSGGGNWNTSRSVYGESFGPSPAERFRKSSAGGMRPMSNARESGYFPPIPPIPASSSVPNARGGAPRSRTVSQPANPSPTHRTGPKKAAPPSSWKKAGV